MRTESSPVVVAGMHRSGTSLVASILAASGVSMGDRLLPADRGNPKGYFEDLGFLDLNRRMLADATRPDDGGHRDWGWTESEGLDLDRFEAYREAARDLVARQTGGGGPWGWKDPRTSLLLDFWDGVLEGAAYLFVYRFPWGVADSIQRLGADLFLRHPGYAWRIWAFYNRRLLDFCRRHRERSILVCADALVRQPRRFAELLRDRLGLDVPEPGLQSLLDAELFETLDEKDPLIPLAAACHPDCAEILGELDAVADLPGTELWSRDFPAAGKARPAGAGARLAVVIPCYDHGEFLVEAVASVERSVPEPCELIVVNDGSREARTLEVLEVLRRAGYQVIDQENSGLAAARNRGIEETAAPYVLPLDSDNRLTPGFIGPALEVLAAHPEIGVVYGDRRDFGLRSEVVNVPAFERDEILPFNFIDACAVLRKEVWKACGGFDGAMPVPGWEDWDLWLGAAERGWQFHHLPMVGFEYRVRPDSMITPFNGEEFRLPPLRYVIAKHRDLYWPRLPELLASAQTSAMRLYGLSRQLPELEAQADAAAAESRRLSARLEETDAAQQGLRLRLDELAAANQDLAARLDERTAERQALLEANEGLGKQRDEAVAERDRLQNEVRLWEKHMAFVESTRAWRWREWLVRLKQRLQK